MADEASKVDTRVTPALHPQNVRALESYDEETAIVLSSAYSAFDSAYRGLVSVHDARAAASKDPTLNEAAVAIATQDVADRVVARVAKIFDKEVASLEHNIKFLEGELTLPIESQASHQIAMEIRKYVNDLPLGKRLSFVQQAINSGDQKSATAILGAPSYLSGMTDEMQAALIQIYHAKNNKPAFVRVKAMKAARDLIMERGGLLFSEIEKAVGMAPHNVRELRERKQNADRHLRSA